MPKKVLSTHWCLDCGNSYISPVKPLSRWKTWVEDKTFKARDITHTCPKCGFVHSETEVSQKKK